MDWARGWTLRQNHKLSVFCRNSRIETEGSQGEWAWGGRVGLSYFEKDSPG